MIPFLLKLVGDFSGSCPLIKHVVITPICGGLHLLNSELVSSLTFCLIDFSNTHFDTAVKRLWPRYMLYPLDKHYAEYYSMTKIFSDRAFSSQQYAGLWNEVCTKSYRFSVTTITDIFVFISSLFFFNSMYLDMVFTIEKSFTQVHQGIL